MVQGKWHQDREVYALRMREVNMNSKREIRAMATRSTCKRLTDCANRLVLLNYGETILVVVPVLGITCAARLWVIWGLFFLNWMPKDYSLVPLDQFLTNSATNESESSQRCPCVGLRYEFFKITLLKNKTILHICFLDILKFFKTLGNFPGCLSDVNVLKVHNDAHNNPSRG